MGSLDTLPDLCSGPSDNCMYFIRCSFIGNQRCMLGTRSAHRLARLPSIGHALPQHTTQKGRCMPKRVRDSCNTGIKWMHGFHLLRRSSVCRDNEDVIKSPTSPGAGQSSFCPEGVIFQGWAAANRRALLYNVLDSDYQCTTRSTARTWR